MSLCSNISSVVSSPPADLRSPSLRSVSPLYDLEDVEVPVSERVEESESGSDYLFPPNHASRKKRKHQFPSSWVWGPLESPNGKLVIVDDIE